MPVLLHSAVFLLALISLILCVISIVKPPFPLWAAVLCASIALMVASVPAT
ncbi:MAG: hypothetical protein ACREMY_32020 [bacterium]